MELLPQPGVEHVHSLLIIDHDKKVFWFADSWNKRNSYFKESYEYLAFEVRFQPEIPFSLAEKMLPVHIMGVDASTGWTSSLFPGGGQQIRTRVAGLLTGSSLNIARSTITPLWSSQLHFDKEDKIVAIKTKPNYRQYFHLFLRGIERLFPFKFRMWPDLYYAIRKDELALTILIIIDALLTFKIYSTQ